MADQNDARFDSLVRTDPVMQSLFEQYKAAPTFSAQGPFMQKMRARATELGIPKDYQLQVSHEGIKGVDHQNWWDRNQDKVIKGGIATTFGLMGGNVLANVLGGGSAAASAAKGNGSGVNAVTGGTRAPADIATSAASPAMRLLSGNTASAMPDWLKNMLKVGTVLGGPAVAAGFSNAGDDQRRQADQWQSVINGIVPSLIKLAEINANRAAAAGPLHDRVLQMAMARMPTWAK